MRVVIVAVGLVAVVAVGITIWFNFQQASAPASPDAAGVPQQYDTTGGQKMRPRWNGSGGQSDDATGN